MAVSETNGERLPPGSLAVSPRPRPCPCPCLCPCPCPALALTLALALALPWPLPLPLPCLPCLPCLASLPLPCFALPCLACLIIIAQSAFAKNRTRQQKGLRDRNSPTCTLSQNGYGDNCSQISEPRPTIGAQLSSHYDDNDHNDRNSHNNRSNHNDHNDDLNDDHTDHNNHNNNSNVALHYYCSYSTPPPSFDVGRSSQANFLERNSAMDDSIGGS